MRCLLIFLALLGQDIVNGQSSFIVPIEEAKAIARAYNGNKILEEREINILSDKDSLPAMYLFNYEGGGSLIVSADYRHEPILAQIDKGRLEKGIITGGLLSWFQTTLENIELIRAGKIENAARGAWGWLYFYEMLERTPVPKIIFQELPQSSCEPKESVKTLRGPLIQTEWGQGCSYNDALPSLGCNRSCDFPQKPLTGCIATCLAQISKYYKWPQGFDYSSMTLYWGNKEVQKLMQFSSTAAQTSLGCSTSTAFFSAIVPALKGSFGYGSAFFSFYEIDGLQRIINEIDNIRPLILGACAEKKSFLWWSIPSDCHSWICDGYKTITTSCASYLWLHMNWGWNELGNANNYNGWFTYNHWQVAGRKFQYMKEMVFGIKP